MIMNNNDFVILILSCQKYSDMWTKNILLLDKYWPNHPKAYIVSDGVGIFNISNPGNLLIFPGGASDRLISALKYINSNYVFVTFDDYYFDGVVDSKKLNTLFEFLIDNNGSYLGFFKNKKRKLKPINEHMIARLPLEQTYEVNFYMAMWKKDSLIKCLRNNEDIWETEARLTKRSRKNGLKMFCCLDKNVLNFKDIIRKGKYLRSSYRFLKKNNLFTSNRQRRSLLETSGLFIKTFFAKHTPNFLKPLFKKIYRKTGNTIYSDYASDDE